MNDRFFCFGDYDDLEVKCLTTCPDRVECMKKQKNERAFEEIEKKIKDKEE